MEKEFWKDIEGFEGIYQVSNLGNVKNVKTGKPLKHFVVGGYYHVGLGRKGVPNKHYLVHRLVAEAFLPNPNNYPIINHKDENKLNNYVHVSPDGSVDQEKSNLEWCTFSYNLTYGSRKPKELSVQEKEEKRKRRILQITAANKRYRNSHPEKVKEWAKRNYEKNVKLKKIEYI